MLRMRFYQWASKIQAERARLAAEEARAGADANDQEVSGVRRVASSAQPEGSADERSSEAHSASEGTSAA